MAAQRSFGSKTVTRFRCIVCGRMTAGRVPVDPHNHRRRGDGTVRYPRRHNGPDGELCPGCYEEAEWVDVEVRK